MFVKNIKYYQKLKNIRLFNNLKKYKFFSSQNQIKMQKICEFVILNTRLKSKEKVYPLVEQQEIQEDNLYITYRNARN